MKNYKKLLMANIYSVFAFLCIANGNAYAESISSNIEFLDLGLISVPAEKGNLISWRKSNLEPKDIKYNIFRNGEKITKSPISGVTNFIDKDGTIDSVYEIRNSKSKIALGSAKTWSKNYLEIPLDVPKDGITPEGQTYSYTANDASVGDLDGDGKYEVILKWDPTNARDNSQAGFTGNVFIDAYTLEGKKLWRIDLGKNIRAGAHYTQFLVFDFDGNGVSEIAFKTADGTIDGTGKVIGDINANYVETGGELEAKDRTGSVVAADGKLMAQLKGRILKGPEYLTVFEGLTGKAIDTVRYEPQRALNNDNPTNDEMKRIWGDGYGNRMERYNATVAYLDGPKPSMVFSRGYYDKTVIAAYDLVNNKLVKKWVFDSKADGIADNYSHQGNHQVSVADIDDDGKQEIVFGAMAIDNDGKPMWTTGLGHGDAMHVSDLDPTNPGLEKFGVHENMANGNIGSALINLKDGKLLWTKRAEKDTGRGVAIDIDPRHKGTETWASNSPTLFNIKGEEIAPVRPKQMNFAVWWDGDLLREILDGNTISKWDWNENKTNPILVADGTTSNNGTKSNPALSGDILGDWREEVILRTTDNKALRIYATNIPTKISMPSLMEDPQYRVAISWQNSAYNQPPHPSYYIGEGMEKPKSKPINIVKYKK